MHSSKSPSMPKKRRSPVFTKGELKTYSNAANEAGLETWAIERTDKDGVLTRFVAGVAGTDLAGPNEWDAYEKG